LPDLMAPSIKERLWHKMRADLARFVPETADNNLLMCCACGRFLPQEHFGLEHCTGVNFCRAAVTVATAGRVDFTISPSAIFSQAEQDLSRRRGRQSRTL
jgi:hypothetical protein